MKPSNQYYVIYKDGWRIVDASGNFANKVVYKSKESASAARWWLFEREGRKIIQEGYKAKRGLTELERHFKSL